MKKEINKLSKKIILIDPPGWVGGLNTGLEYIAAMLRKAGHDVKVIDFNNNPYRINERLSSVEGADIVGISIKSFIVEENIIQAKDILKI